mmetsp:Transcript_32242/g.58948  ORF Transcript_32242/g.58948 Transcript_32242/m.58948 type:complete len:116 (+) Transcript_32242:241-588(+)
MIASPFRRIFTTLLAVALALPRALAVRPVAHEVGPTLPNFAMSVLRAFVEKDVRGYEGIIEWSVHELPRGCLLLFILEQLYDTFLTVSICGAILMWLSPIQEACRALRIQPERAT